MLLIIWEEHWPFLWPLLGSPTPATRLSSRVGSEAVNVRESKPAIDGSVVDHLCPVFISLKIVESKVSDIKAGFLNSSTSDIWAR